MFVLELRVLPVLRRSPEGSGAPMDFADVDSDKDGYVVLEHVLDLVREEGLGVYRCF